MDLEAAISKVAKTITKFPGQTRQPWFGHGFLADHEVSHRLIAEMLLREASDGRLATEFCFSSGEMVARMAGTELTWQEIFNLGRFLISCLTYAKVCRLERGEERGAYYIVRESGYPKVEPEQTDIKINKPFPSWNSPIDALGNRLVKPSGPQQKATQWMPEPGQFSNSLFGGKPVPWIQAIHKLESTAFRINSEMLNWAKQLDSNPATRIHRLPRAHRAYDPTRPFLINAPTEKDIRSRRARYEQSFCLGEQLKNQVFFQRAYADYRGRLYLPSFSHTGTDFERSLIEFSDGVPLTRKGWDYLMLHTANVYGESAEFGKKIARAKAMLDLFVQVADSPENSFDIWSKADKPFCFLRACIEVRNAVRAIKVSGRMNYRKFTTYLPCEIDQSNSAFQHIALIMGDEELKKLSNLQGSYSDLYTTIADRIDIPADDWEKRKIGKKVALPWGYGAGDLKITEQLREWASSEEKAAYLGTLKWKDFLPLVTKIRKEIETAVPAVSRYREKVSSVLNERLRKGATEVVWQTPMMFEVHQRRMKTKKVKGKVFSGGGDNGALVELRAKQPTNQVDRDRHRRSTPPNIVHSFDAAVVHSILFNATYSGKVGNTTITQHPLPFPVITIHDAFSAHAPNLPELHTRLLIVLSGLYAHFDPFNNWLMLVGGTKASRKINSSWAKNARNAFS